MDMKKATKKERQCTEKEEKGEKKWQMSVKEYQADACLVNTN